MATAPAQTLPAVPVTTSSTGPTAVTTTAPVVSTAPVTTTVPSTAYQVWQGLQGAVLCDADRLCGPNRAYVRSPANVATPTIVSTSPTAAFVSGGPVSTSLQAPPFMQSIGSQAQPIMTLPQAQPMPAAPAVTSSSGVFVPSPVAGAGSPVITSVQPGSGFVPSPSGNASFVVTSMSGASPVAVAPGTAAVPMQSPPAFQNIPAGADPPFPAKPAAKAKEEKPKRSKKKKAKCCGCF